MPHTDFCKLIIVNTLYPFLIAFPSRPLIMLIAFFRPNSILLMSFLKSGAYYWTQCSMFNLINTEKKEKKMTYLVLSYFISIISKIIFVMRCGACTAVASC